MRKLIIFDFDGTLVDSEILASEIYPEVWATFGIDISQEFFLKNFVGVGSDAEIVKQTMARISRQEAEIADQKFKEAIRNRLRPVQGMKALLAQMKDDICVASNSSLNHVLDGLATTGLAHFFGERIFSAKQVARPKPAPDVLLHAARVLGNSPADCIFIEDSHSGILAAKNADMRVVGFTGGSHFSQIGSDRLFNAGSDAYFSDIEKLQSYLLG